MDGSVSPSLCVECQDAGRYTRTRHPIWRRSSGNFVWTKQRKPGPIKKYVDDSTVFKICNQTRVSVIQDSTNITALSSNNNEMCINTSKTKEMVVSVKIEHTLNLIYIYIYIYIEINVTDIERVTQEKVPGVTMLSDLVGIHLQMKSFQSQRKGYILCIG